MKPLRILFSFLPLLSALAPGETDTAQDSPRRLPAVRQKPLPPEIQALVERLGRYPPHDFNRDGWEDLWQSVYGFSRDGRNFTDHLQRDPEGDADGDGVSNYEEMLDFRNPWAADLPARQLTPEEAKAARATAARAVRENDRKKLARFHALLEDRAALVRPATEDKEKDRQPQMEETPEESAEGTSFYFGDEMEWDGGLMLCSTGGPRIIATERLSNGQYLLAWEGNPEKLYDIEWSDDLVSWSGGGMGLPTLAGTGTWGQTSFFKKRFFRVIEDINSSTVPSDPLGGNGASTYGGSVLIDPTGTLATVTVNLPAYHHPIVSLHVDGDFYSFCDRQSDGTYTCAINRERLTTGLHSTHAVIQCHVSTTESPENPQGPSSVTVRSAEVPFENTWHGLTGVGATEREIRTGEDGSPQSTLFHVEYPAFHNYDGPAEEVNYALRIDNDSGEDVWFVEGSVPGPGPGQLIVEWDGTDMSGATLPDGIYTAQFFVGDHYYGASGDIYHAEPMLIRNGPAEFRLLALGEAMPPPPAGGWTAARVAAYRPEWWNQKGTSAGAVNTPTAWGPWAALGSGPTALVGGLQTYMDPAGARRYERQAGGGQTEQQIKKQVVTRAANCSVRSWVSNGRFNDARPWAGANTTPASAFVTGNPFNTYDAGFLIGHGVASSASSYEDAAQQTINLPSQHYFPFIGNPATGDAVWIKSGQMAEKFGAAGSKLRWMFVVTCNYLRVGAHNPAANHDIWTDMKTNKTLPIGPALRVLCSYTTSVDVTGKLGHAFAKGAMGYEPDDENMNVVDAWNYAWANSENSSDKSYTNPGESKQVRNARSVYWPGCDDDIISAKTKVPASPPAGPLDQDDLQATDSKYPNP